MLNFQYTGILGLDEILGGQTGVNGVVRGRPQGDRILIVGPPGSGKTLLALSLLYKALTGEGSEKERGLFLTTEQPAGYLTDSISSGLFMKQLERLQSPPNVRLDMRDFPPYEPPFASEPPPNDQAIVDSLLRRLHAMTQEEAPQRPCHIVLDGLTAMQAVLESQAEARRLTNLILGRLSFPRSSFDLIVVTSEAYPDFTGRRHGDGLREAFDSYLFDTVICLDIIETPADRRLRTIEISKSRGRHARTGRHTFSIVNEAGLPSLIRSEAAREEITACDTPVIIFPREPRHERPVEKPSQIHAESQYLETGIKNLDALLDREKHRGLLKRSITVLIGGPGTAASLLGLGYLAKGLEDKTDQPVLLVSFGRDREDFDILANNFPWFKMVNEHDGNAFHFLYYRPVNLDQNRLLYEVRKEIERYSIDRVLIDSISSLPLVDIDTESASDFLVTLIGLLKELRCTAMLSYASDQPPNPLAAPGRFIPSLADNIFVLRNAYTVGQDMEMQKHLFILKARGTNAISQEVGFSIGEELAIVPPRAIGFSG